MQVVTRLVTQPRFSLIHVIKGQLSTDAAFSLYLLFSIEFDKGTDCRARASSLELLPLLVHVVVSENRTYYIQYDHSVLSLHLSERRHNTHAAFPALQLTSTLVLDYCNLHLVGVGQFQHLLCDSWPQFSSRVQSYLELLRPRQMSTSIMASNTRRPVHYHHVLKCQFF